MKKIFLITSLLSVNAFAGGFWVDPKEKNKYLQCTIGEARAYASVGSYFDWCDYQRKNNIGQHGNKSPIWFVSLPGQRNCYAPCDHGYEHRVRTGEDESMIPEYLD